MSATLRLTALDTLFFRESRPFDAIGGSELASVFPPPPRTVLGAVRTAIGDSLGADWKQFQEQKEKYILPDGKTKLTDLIGWNDELGKIELNGIWLSLGEERLYPAPQFLLQGGEQPFTRLRIGAAVQTHVGYVRLPQAPDREHRYKPLEAAWLTRAGLEKVLKGGVPDEAELDLFAREPRLGIARDNSTRKAQDGLLYQSCHIRPKPGLAIEADISGLENFGMGNRIVRLGAEGRMADISSAKTPDVPAKPKVADDTCGLIIVLLTPARFENEFGNWLLPEFVRHKSEDGADVWKGSINKIPLTLHAAALGKAQREGGWDMAAHKPRAVQSLIPPGSSYYCKVDDGNITAAIEALHDKQIGKDPKFGRGKIACGLWNENEFLLNNREKKHE